MRAIRRIKEFLNKKTRQSRPYLDYGYQDPRKNIERRQRVEYKYIIDWIEPKSRVLDLGCGDGSLGEALIKEKGCEAFGIEIDKNGVEQSRGKGLSVLQASLDDGLGFEDRSFDYVVINVTLQMVYRPDFVMSEALRVGKKVIISFPNFASMLSRIEVLFGRFPRFPLFGYKWYNTRNIHLFSIKDFIEYCRKLDVRIIKRQPLWLDSRQEHLMSNLFPNLFSGTCIFMIEQSKK